jgi:hypothetical protein
VSLTHVVKQALTQQVRGVCARGACAHWYALVREKVVRLRNAYPLLAIGEALAMLLASLEHLSRASFDTRSVLSPDSAGKQVRVVAAEHNWVLPLLLSRELVALVTLFAMWVCWERQRYYRQLVSSPAFMQVRLLQAACLACRYYRQLVVPCLHAGACVCVCVCV